MLRLTLWTCVGLFGCLYAFGGDLSPQEQAAVDAYRSDRVSVVAMVRGAFSDETAAQRKGGYVPTLAELEAEGRLDDEIQRVASFDAAPDALVQAASLSVPATDHAVTVATDPAKLAALIATPLERAEPSDSPEQVAAPQAAAETAEDMILRVVSAARVNVRSGPSTGYDVVGQVLAQDIVRVISNPYSEWVKILVEGDGVEGYMSARFLDELPE